MNKLNMMTPNMVNENIEKIKQMFPNCVIEHVNGGGVSLNYLLILIG